jgi:hypothetical protein
VHTGERLHAIKYLLIKRKQLTVVVVPDICIEPDSKDMVTIETGVELHEISESANEQPSANQKD